MVFKFDSETSQYVVQNLCRGDDGCVVGGRDRISELPEEILCHILSSLPTITDVVRTSILSSVWRKVWISVPVIRCVLDNKDAPNSYSINNIKMLVPITQPKGHVKEMYLDFPSSDYDASYPFLLTICLAYQNLAVLTLNGLKIDWVPPSFCHPCLKKLSLCCVFFLTPKCINNFLIGCPVLEDLHIERFGDDNLVSKMVCVQSSSLKSFTFYSRCDGFGDARVSSLVISASNLERLDLYIDIREQVEVRCSLSSLVAVSLSINKMYASDVCGTRLRRHASDVCKTRLHASDVYKTRLHASDVCRTRLLDLLHNLSNTKYLYLSSTTKFRFNESIDELRHLNYQLPIFNNLTHLEVKLCDVGSSILHCLLGSSPNLTSHITISKDSLELWPKPHRSTRHLHLK